jgi:hypothetical protein
MRFLVGLLGALALVSGCDEDDCVDLDGDGVFAACDAFSDAVPGPDCNDDPDDPAAVDNWDSCDSCTDADGDGTYVGCDQFTGDGLLEDDDDQAFEMMIVVEGRLADAMAPRLEVYRQDLRDRGVSTAVVVWSEGTVESLRDTLQEAHEVHGMEGAFLVGELPTAWFEQHAHDQLEEFPTDIFLQNFSREWQDRDENGVYDDYSSPSRRLRMDIYLSRVTGSVAQLMAYFDKVHRYKTEGPLMDPSMFIFIDNDWQGYGFENQQWGLEGIYDQYTRMETPQTSTRAGYVQQMSEDGGGEYVYQWVHSSATTLYFEGYGAYDLLDIFELQELGVSGSFYNLFDCSASRFTEANLAETYLHQEHGLATIGSTKPGGIYEPLSFHRVLARGGSWGEGYIRWYEDVGQYDDSWFLGIVIMGDPTLTLSDVTRRAMREAEAGPDLSPAALDSLMGTLRRFDTDVESFEMYRQAHPQFF